MVEVYAQTAEEYIAERKPPHTIVTEDSDGILSLKKNESGLIQLLAKEGGRYLLQIEGGCHINAKDYTGSGILIPGEGFRREVISDTVYYYNSVYAQLNANEPLYLRVQAFESINASLSISLTRVPESEALAQ